MTVARAHEGATGRGARPGRWAAAAAVLALALAGCSDADTPDRAGTGDASPAATVGAPTPEPEATPSTPPAPTSGDGVEDVPEDTTDYSTDAGQNIQTYEYPDDPEPADSVLATLCNLNQEWLAGLRATDGGTPVVDDTLRMNLISLKDQLDTWDTLRPHTPEAVADIDTAQRIYDAWDKALLASDNGDAAGAAAGMADGEELLAGLPRTSPDNCIP